MFYKVLRKLSFNIGSVTMNLCFVYQFHEVQGRVKSGWFTGYYWRRVRWVPGGSTGFFSESGNVPGQFTELTDTFTQRSEQRHLLVMVFRLPPNKPDDWKLGIFSASLAIFQPVVSDRLWNWQNRWVDNWGVNCQTWVVLKVWLDLFYTSVRSMIE